MKCVSKNGSLLLGKHLVLPESSLHDLFLSCVQSKPNSTALILHDGMEISYSELFHLSSKFQLALEACGVSNGALVGVCLERSVELLAFVLAILGTKATFLMVEPMAPPGRKRYIFDDSKPAFVVTSTMLLPIVSEQCPDITFMTAENLRTDQVFTEIVTQKRSYLDDVMYVMYTSGSTGKPKGVMVLERAILNRINWMWKDFPLQENEVLAFKTSTSFGDSIWEMIGGLLHGNPTLILPTSAYRDPDELIQWIASYKVTRLTLIPSVLGAVLMSLPVEELRKLLACLRIVVCSGESLPKAISKQFISILPFCKLINLYGSTEVGNDVTYYVAHDMGGVGSCELASQSGSIPIGIPIANSSIEIMDDSGGRTPLGQPGEIWVSGYGVASGYMNQMALTDDTFVTVDSVRYFKTGDLGQILEDGNIGFLGRKDSQIKIRGARVQLEEIEAILVQHDIVKEAAVGIRLSLQQLVACIVFRGPASLEKNEADLQQHVHNYLPDYMAPSIFTSVESIPHTESGKVDRNTLNMHLEEHIQRKGTHSCDNSNLSCDEMQMLRIWEEVLSRTIDNPDASFTSLGGHSLLAFEIVQKSKLIFHKKLPVHTLFGNTSLRDLTHIINQQSGEQSERVIPRQKSDGNDNSKQALVSLQQEEMLMSEQMTDKPLYNISVAYELRNLSISESKIHKAISQVLEKHHALRTVFSRNCLGNVVQLVESLDNRPGEIAVAGKLAYTYETCASLTVAEIQRKLHSMANKKHNLLDGTISTKFTLLDVKCPLPKHILHLSMHHINGDGWSTGIILEDFIEFYQQQLNENKQFQTEENKLSYVGYASNQRESNHIDVSETSLKYWRAKLRGPIPETLLPDFPRPEIQSFDGESVIALFPQSTRHAVDRFCRQNDFTPFMVLLSSFKILLARQSGNYDITIGTPLANRDASTKDVAGLFIITTAIRTILGKHDTFKQVLNKLKSSTLEAYENQTVPFSRLASKLDIPRDKGKNSIFQVLFAYQNAEKSNPFLEPFQTIDTTAKNDIEVNIQEDVHTGGYFISTQFCTQLFKGTTIQRLMVQWLQFLNTLLEHSHENVFCLQFMSDEEVQRIIQLGCGEENCKDIETKTLDMLLGEQAEKNPRTTAIEYESQHFSYADLARNVDSIARQLRYKFGCNRGMCVAICMERSPQFIILIIAVLRTGAHYVPMEGGLPQERIAFIIEDCGADVLLTDGCSSFQSDTKSLKIPWVIFSDLIAESIPKEKLDYVENSRTPHDLCYIMYTSGSTGRPKGIRTKHRQIVSRFNTADIYGIGTNTRVAQIAPLSFDMSTFEIWATLINGGTLVMMSKDVVCSAVENFGKRVLERNIDVICMTTALFNVLAEVAHTGIFESLKCVMFGGETGNANSVRKVLARPPKVLMNVYGPTEATVFTTFHVFDPNTELTVKLPIGRPIPNTYIYVVDRNFNIQPIGVPGELLIGGPGVAHGYLNNGELTATQFITDPISGKSEKLYKSGDIVCMMEDGTLSFLGREDSQIKLRGHRIELGEIESVLRQHKYVNDALVLVRNDLIENDKQLVAYVKLSKKETVFGEGRDEITSYLSQKLPAYMVPHFVVFMDSFPLNSHGKINCGLLPIPDKTIPHRDCDGKSDITTIEKKVISIFKQVLEQDSVTSESDFFKLGGHSLLATKLLAHVYREFNIDLPLSALFEFSTVHSFSGRIQDTCDKKQMKQKEKLTQRFSTNMGSNYDYELSPLQDFYWANYKINPASTEYSIPYGLHVSGSMDVSVLQESVERLCERHSTLRTTFQMGKSGKTLGHVRAATKGAFSFSHILLETSPEHSQHAKKVLTKQAAQVFKLEKGPLMKVTLLSGISMTAHLLFINVHHSITDGLGLVVLLDDLFHIYNTLMSDDAYQEDYSQLSYDHMAQVAIQNIIQNRDDKMQYWRKLFANIIPLQTTNQLHNSCHSNDGFQNSEAKRVKFAISSDIADQVRKTASKCSVTPFTVMLTLYQIALREYCQGTVICGIPVDIRPPRCSKVVGTFINMMPMKMPESEHSISFAELVTSQSITLMHSYENMLPLNDIIACYQQSVRAGRCSVPFKTLFEMNSFDLFSKTLTLGNDAKCHTVDVDDYFQTCKTDIDFNVIDGGKGKPMKGDFYFKLNAVPMSTMEDLPNLLEKILILATKNHGMTIENLLVKGKMTEAVPNTIHKMFERSALMHCSKTAIVHGSEHISFGDAILQIKNIAAYIQSAISFEKDRNVIGLCMERCTKAILAMLGVLMSGAAYVFIDPKYPEQRIQKVISDTNAKLVLCMSATANRASQSAKWINIDACLKLGQSMDFEEAMVHSKDLAYILYTSGSTGEPKGVEITHQGVIDRTTCEGFLPMASTDRVGQLCSFNFDAYLQEVYRTLFSGATCFIFDYEHILQPKLLALLFHENHINIVYPVTPIYNLLAEHAPDALNGMKYVCIAGDKANPKLLLKILTDCNPPPLHLVNAYGPTETTCVASFYFATKTDMEFVVEHSLPVPIGLPLPGTELLIVNQDMELVPNGEKGQLLIGGVGLSPGYLNDEEKTNRKFIHHSFESSLSQRWYQTGDLVCIREDGMIEFHGRIDDQVKVNGFRIELGEIESVLLTHDLVQEAVVIVREDVILDHPSLVAYVVIENMAKRQSASKLLKEYCFNKLPKYMVPNFIVSVGSFPLGPTGKVHRKMLPMPGNSIKEPNMPNDQVYGEKLTQDEIVKTNASEVSSNSNILYEDSQILTDDLKQKPQRPAGSVLNIMRSAWAKTLGTVEQFRLDDDFFDVGGTSILLVKLHSIMEEDCGQSVDIMKLFQMTTMLDHIELVAPDQVGTVLADAEANDEDQLGETETERNDDRCSVPDIDEDAEDVHICHMSLPDQNNTEPQASTVAVNDYAVVGMACRYPKSASIKEYWENLEGGVDCIRHLTHDELIQAGQGDLIEKNPNYVADFGYIENVDHFDPHFFNVTKRDAQLTDPQHRLFLECCYEAMEDGGLVPEAFNGRIGVFSSCFRNTYGHLHKLLEANPFDAIGFHGSSEIPKLDPASILRVEIGNMCDGSATFVSYKLGLTGPSLAVQTACSSSSAAIHMAIRSIQVQDCEAAIVGGVTVYFPMGMGHVYQPGMILSKEGYLRPFDAEADGSVSADGVGVIVIMPLKKAVDEGYNIHGVIKGSSMNNDGNRKTSYSATSPESQAQCMREALKEANVNDPNKDIGFIEAHGPGTVLGDMLEMQALRKVYDGKKHIYLGSNKSNIGHCAHASSIAGLIKAILSVKHAKIPPTLHFKKFNTLIAATNPPFTVNTRAVDWPEYQRPCRAAVNSLGQGGTNIHMIVEEYRRRPNQAFTSHSALIPFSAKTKTSLNAMENNLLDFLRLNPSVDLMNVAYTLSAGRQQYNFRDFVLASNVSDAIHKLKRKVESNSSGTKVTGNDRATLVFVFPGQGSQFTAMARQLYDNEPSFKKEIDNCLEIAATFTAIDLRSILLGKNPHLDKTYAQITIFIVEYCIAKLLMSWGLMPNYMIGHSIGEITAAVVSGVFSIEHGLKVVINRCNLMQTIKDSGAMLAVQLSESNANMLTTQFDVDLAAVNSQTQVVLSGKSQQIDHLETHLKSQNIKCKKLDTFQAFHSSLVDAIMDEYESVLKTVDINEPGIQIASAVTGKIVPREMASIKYWTRQMRQTVHFKSAAECLLKNNHNLYLSVGPGNALNTMLRSISHEFKLLQPTLLKDGYDSFLESLGSLWKAHLPIDWARRYKEFAGKHFMSLPTYPFNRIQCTAEGHMDLTGKGQEGTYDGELPLEDPTKSFFARTTKGAGGDTKGNVRSKPSTKQNIPTSLESKPVKRQQKPRNKVRLLHHTAPKKSTQFHLQNTREENLQKHVKEFFENNFPGENGCVGLVNKEGGMCIVLTKQQDSPVDQIQFGAVSSIFTVSLLNAMIERNIIEPTTTVMELITDDDVSGWLGNITLDHLASHTSGLPYLPDSLPDDLEMYTVDRLFEDALVIHPEFKPGTSYMYSAFALSLLGNILAAVMDDAYITVLSDVILTPFEVHGVSAVSQKFGALTPAVGLQGTIGSMSALMRTVSTSETFKRAMKTVALPVTWNMKMTPILLGESLTFLATSDTCSIITISQAEVVALEVVEKLMDDFFKVGCPDERILTKFNPQVELFLSGKSVKALAEIKYVEPKRGFFRNKMKSRAPFSLNAKCDSHSSDSDDINLELDFMEKEGQTSLTGMEIVEKCLSELLVMPVNDIYELYSNDTPFGDIGVDSLQAITFVEMLSTQATIQLPVECVFEYPTIDLLSHYVDTCLLSKKETGSSEPNNTVSNFAVRVRNHLGKAAPIVGEVLSSIGFPYMIRPQREHKSSLSDLKVLCDTQKVAINRLLQQHGAILFRGFDVHDAADFAEILNSMVDSEMTFKDYKDGISPRTEVADNVYTSTEYPKQHNMACHNEMSYCSKMPSRIYFFCQTPPGEHCGGETPLADSRAIYNGLDGNIMKEFTKKRLMYITNSPSKGQSVGKCWQDMYQTNSQEDVEKFLDAEGIQYDWTKNNGLRTVRVHSPVRQHPVLKQVVWCNHSHLFHPSDLPVKIRNALENRYQPKDMPKNCFFGDGTEIPEAYLNHVRSVIEENTVVFPWQGGDVLLVDNMLIAHGRRAFTGNRKILVAMS